MPRALISVSDKRGILSFAEELVRLGWDLVSTGGTAALLREGGVKVTPVDQVTGFPEILDGRVKTLHPAVHAGLLARPDRTEHVRQLEQHGVRRFDLIAVNLYPFQATIASPGVTFEDAIENIDIGGPSMLRSAAKNFEFVLPVVDPKDYPRILDLLAHGDVDFDTRRELAAKVFTHTADYDNAIAGYLTPRQETLPTRVTLSMERRQILRYGENPQQRAALYLTAETRPGVVTARQIQGKELSYNNINDTDAAYELVAEFDAAESAAVAIIKHTNPCGVALGESLLEAYEKALSSDPVAAFGGVVALNRKLDGASARKIVEIFTEVIIAPEADDAALAIIAAKKNLRLMLAGSLPDLRAPTLDVRSVAGGLLVQDRDKGVLEEGALKVVTKRAPTPREMADLRFAWRIAKHVKSNAIVYAKNGVTVGIGAGQMSRVDSARLAARKAEEAAEMAGLPEPLTRGSVVASDAFFPFADGLVATIEAGATAVIQPGGSVRDAEVIAVADEADVAMVFTGMRHFRH